MIVGMICNVCGVSYSRSEYKDFCFSLDAIMPCGHTNFSELIQYGGTGTTTEHAVSAWNKALYTIVNAGIKMRYLLPKHPWDEKPEMLYANPEWGHE